MNQNNQIALGATFLISVFLLILLILAKMSWNPLTDTPEPDPYIVMNQLPETEEEYMEVEVEELPLLNSDSESPAFTPEEMDNESQAAPPSATEPMPATPKPSPVQVEKPKQEPKPSPADLKKQEDEDAIKRAQEAARAGFNQSKNNTNVGEKDEGKNGSPTGENQQNPDSRTGKGTAKIGGGWKPPVYSKNISSQTTGSVEFVVSVNADGSVAEVKILHADPNLTSATKNACMAEIKRRKFTPPPNNTEGTTAYVTFTFQDPK